MVQQLVWLYKLHLANGSGLITKSCLTLCHPMDCSPLGISLHGISQAWILEWFAISFLRGSSWPRDQTLVSCIVGGLLHCRWILHWLSHQGSPIWLIIPHKRKNQLWNFFNVFMYKYFIWKLANFTLYILCLIKFLTLLFSYVPGVKIILTTESF